MELSQRLKGVADFVSAGRILADIGTDHGYLPIYLIQNEKIEKAYACDINQNPLLKATENMKKYKLEHKMEVRQGAGLLPVLNEPIDVVTIAGMGGMTVISILEEAKDFLKNIKQIILQPQHDVGAVRKFVHAMGFSIVDEKMILEWGKYYTIINAMPVADNGVLESYTSQQYEFGKILMEKKDMILKQYVEHKVEKFHEILSSAEKPIDEVIKHKKMYEEVLQCLSLVKKS